MSSSASASRLSVMASLPSVGAYSSSTSSIYSKRATTNILERPLNKTRGAEVTANIHTQT